MNVGNINTNLNNQIVNTGKAPSGPAFNTKDVFTPSVGGAGAFENLPGTLSAKDAGKILMGNKNDAMSVHTNTVEKPEWREQGGISYHSDLVFDKENKCLYGGVEEIPTTSSHNHWLTSFNTDGSVRWKFKGDEFRDGPVLDKEGNVYFCGRDDLHALDKDGNEKWSVKLERLFCTSQNPVISSDGTVFAVNSDFDNKEETSKINAVKDGKVKWTYNTKVWSDKYNSIIVGKDDTVYLAAAKNVKEKGFIFSKDTSQNFFIGLKPDGTEKFRVPVESWGKEHRGCLAEGVDGTIYTVQGGGKLVAYTPDGKEKFQRKLTRNYQGSEYSVTTGFAPAVDSDGNVYIAAKGYNAHDLICMDKDGNEKWRTGFEGEFTAKPEFTPDGKIAVGFSSGNMQILDKDGKLEKKFLVKSGLHKNQFYGNIEGDTPISPSTFAFDENGQVFVAAYDWVSAYDLNANPLEQVMNKPENAQGAEAKDSTIKMEKEEVIIGGVRVKKNIN